MINRGKGELDWDYKTASSQKMVYAPNPMAHLSCLFVPVFPPLEKRKLCVKFPWKQLQGVYTKDFKKSSTGCLEDNNFTEFMVMFIKKNYLYKIPTKKKLLFK